MNDYGLREQLIEINNKHMKIFKNELFEYVDLQNDSIETILDELSSIQEFIQIWKDELYEDEQEIINYYNDLYMDIERIFSNVLLTA